MKKLEARLKPKYHIVVLVDTTLKIMDKINEWFFIAKLNIDTSFVR